MKLGLIIELTMAELWYLKHLGFEDRIAQIGALGEGELESFGHTVVDERIFDVDRLIFTLAR